jgi:hypothetical protein
MFENSAAGLLARVLLATYTYYKHNRIFPSGNPQSDFIGSLDGFSH